MATQFTANIDLTTEPNPDNYSYFVAKNGSTMTVVVGQNTVNAALNGVRDFIATKVPQGEIVLRVEMTVTTGPAPA